SMPDSPYFCVLNGDFISLPPFLRPLLATTDSGSVSPSCFVSSSLGSKVSTCDGPPFMNRKIRRFAFAGKCGAFGASGFADFSAAARKPASAKTFASASAPKPPPMRVNTSRRESGFGKNIRGSVTEVALACCFAPGAKQQARLLIDVQEFVRAQQHLGVLLPARQRFAALAAVLRGEERQAELHVAVRRRAAVQQQERLADARLVVL